MPLARTANGIFAVLALAGCASDQSALDATSRETPVPGRWTLTVPNAPSCGLEFGGAVGAHNGTVAPDGGCPGNFYLSRHWTQDANGLTITDDENQVLVQLKSAGNKLEGHSASGVAVTLSR
jgi:hypothetical protein